MKIKISRMGLGNFFVEKKAVGRDDQRLIGSFRGNYIYGIDDYETNFCNDGDDDKIEAQRLDEERRIYWESQQFLLQEILDQYSSNGLKLREEIKRHVDIARDSTFCSCLDKNLSGSGGCIKCLRLASVDRLCSEGFRAALCTSKWRRTCNMPGGTHEYIELIATTEGRRKQIPLLVELGFCDEFRMAKACVEYHRMIDLLPEIYIGKADHLNAIIRVVCEAAKKSSEEQRIHMGPWRKRGFMQMKWSAASKEKKLAS